MNQEYVWPLEAGKSKQTDFSPEPQKKEQSSSNTKTLAPSDPC